MHGEKTYRLLAPMVLSDLLRTQPKLIVQCGDGQIPSLSESREAFPNSPPSWETTELAASKTKLMSEYRPYWVDSQRKITIFLHQ
jgi:hypothetical protein